ncbi:MAG: GNAT family N-acetyltransferase [Bacteroidetes bacterium HGW-Bacteroidetes-18]|nr:MAG: GNAT family N-acetyltransferase [Bacteroidetes bacterium HGW-Bacteroidetes-18]
MKTYKHFETERLILQQTTSADAEFIFELVNTPKWLANIGDRNVKSVEDAKVYIEQRMTVQLEKLGYGNYTLIRKSDKIKIGTCGLYDREGLEGIDIGFALLPAYENLGYGYESAAKLLEIAVKEFHLTKISAITTKENIASQKLIEKLGLKYIKPIKIPNDENDLLLYGINC